VAGTIVLGNIDRQIHEAVGDDAYTFAASGLSKLLKWSRRRINQIVAAAGLAVHGAHGSDKIVKEKLRQQESQEQLLQEQKPDPNEPPEPQ
jgi:hypothetical protein